MKKIVIKQPNILILSIINALKTSTLGIGIRDTHNIIINRGNYDSQIEFRRKDNKMIKPIDFFILGYMIGRDYDK
jgi:hypothetical protein